MNLISCKYRQTDNVSVCLSTFFFASPVANICRHFVREKGFSISTEVFGKMFSVTEEKKGNLSVTVFLIVLLNDWALGHKDNMHQALDSQTIFVYWINSFWVFSSLHVMYWQGESQWMGGDWIRKRNTLCLSKRVCWAFYGFMFTVNTSINPSAQPSPTGLCV